jgi:hypothetical protein
MTINLTQCSVEELWRYVSTHLEREGISTVLVGGAVVSVYTQDAYRSGDLDMVPPIFMDSKKITAALAKIGFIKDKHRYYEHPDCRDLFIDIVSPPVAIGEEINIQSASWEVDGVTIKILSPTDCVKDRLASYIHYQAQDCFLQALMVARKHPVDYPSLKTWCQNEGAEWAYQAFLKEMEKKFP